VTGDNLIAILASGLVLGSLYALMASGLSLVWGTLQIFNFAHGAMLTFGAYVAWSMNQVLGSSVGQPAAAILAIGVSVIFGVILERTLVRPFLSMPNGDLIAMITTLAGAAITQQLIQLIWGTRFKQLPPLVEGSVLIGETAISAHSIVIMLLAPGGLMLLRWFLSATDTGRAVRAVSQNPDAARLAGLNVQRTYTATFAVAGAFAGAAGVMLGGIVVMTPTMGNDPMLRAFIVVAFGGLGSLGGTIASAYLLGVAEAASVFFVGLYYTPVVLFGMLIVILLFRPRGVFTRSGT
jgi:branched-chain amino acid transport system permease protein